MKKLFLPRIVFGLALLLSGSFLFVPSVLAGVCKFRCTNGDAETQTHGSGTCTAATVSADCTHDACVSACTAISGYVCAGRAGAMVGSAVCYEAPPPPPPDSGDHTATPPATHGSSGHHGTTPSGTSAPTETSDHSAPVEPSSPATTHPSAPAGASLCSFSCVTYTPVAMQAGYSGTCSLAAIEAHQEALADASACTSGCSSTCTRKCGELHATCFNGTSYEPRRASPAGACDASHVAASLPTTPDASAGTVARCIVPPTVDNPGTGGSGGGGGSNESASPPSARLYNPLGTTDLNRLIARVVRALTGLVGSVALLWFVWGGIVWMTAGESERLKDARQIMSNAAIGLVLIFFSYMIASMFLSALSLGS